MQYSTILFRTVPNNIEQKVTIHSSSNAIRDIAYLFNMKRHYITFAFKTPHYKHITSQKMTKHHTNIHTIIDYNQN